MVKIGIIGGKGRMGSALADLLTSQGQTVRVSDRRTTLTNRALAQWAEVVVVSVPIDQTKCVMEEVGPWIKPSGLLMDLTSIKAMPVQAMLGSRAAVIGTHPMCNQTTFGAGQTLIYCPARPGRWMPWFKETFEKRGGFTLVRMTPKAHDEQMALAQGLIHFIQIVLGKTLAELHPNLDTLLKLSSPSSQLQLKLTARHLAQEANLYGNIQLGNPLNPRLQRAYANALTELQTIVETQDLKAFERYFNAGKAYMGGFGERALQETDALIHRMLPVHRPSVQPAIPKNALGCLGPEFTFTALAAAHWRGPRKTPIVPLNSIEAVIQAVAKGVIREGIVPIENRLQGTVRETMDALFDHNVSIVGEFVRPIHHCLAVWPEANPREIRTVLSHPQALNQCGVHLKKKFPHAEWAPMTSTAAAMEHVSRQRDRSMAAIGSEAAAERWGLKILAKNIENDPTNATRFVVLRRNPLSKPPVKAKTSVIFHFAQNRPGSLFKVFQIFAELGINLSRIESRPAPKALGEYLFYLDFEESLHRPKGKQALSALKQCTDGVKCLGSY